MAGDSILPESVVLAYMFCNYLPIAEQQRESYASHALMDLAMDTRVLRVSSSAVAGLGFDCRSRSATGASAVLGRLER